MIERLFYVAASPRGARSRSIAVADAFVERLGPPEVERLDLWQVDLPELGGTMIEGRYRLIAGEPVADAARDAWAEIRRHADRLLACDTWLIATPAWNFGLPYRLKHWIDVVTQPGMLFTNDAHGTVIGRGAGRRAVIVAAGALDTSRGGPLAHLDFQVAYLRAWLGFVGVEEISEVRLMPTFGDADAVAAATARARDEAIRLADALQAASAPARV